MAAAITECADRAGSAPATWYAAASERPAAARGAVGNDEIATWCERWRSYTDANTLPTIATPSVPPSSRVVSLTAEPTPALSTLSEPMIDSVAGAVVNPSPPPSNTICTAISP